MNITVTAVVMCAVSWYKIYMIYRQYSRRQTSGQYQFSPADCSEYIIWRAVFRDGQDKGSARRKATQVQEAQTHNSAPTGFWNRDIRALAVEDGALMTLAADGVLGSINSPNTKMSLNNYS
jgi:hypothetical protein